MSHQNMICLKVIYFCFHTFEWNSNHPLKTGTKKTPENADLAHVSQAKTSRPLVQNPLFNLIQASRGKLFSPPFTKTQKHHGFVVRPSYGFYRALLRETQWFFHKPWSWGRLLSAGCVRWRESWLRLVIKRNGFLFIDFSKWLGRAGMDMWNRSHLLMVDFWIT